MFLFLYGWGLEKFHRKEKKNGELIGKETGFVLLLCAGADREEFSE